VPCIRIRDYVWWIVVYKMTAHSLISGKRSRAFVKRGQKPLSKGNKRSQTGRFILPGQPKQKILSGKHRVPTGVTECSDLLLPLKITWVSLHLNRFAKQMFDGGLSLHHLDRELKPSDYSTKGYPFQRSDREFTKPDVIFSLLSNFIFSLLCSWRCRLLCPCPIFLYPGT